MFEPPTLPTLYSDDLTDDEPTAVYPPSFHAVVAALCLDDPDSWPPLEGPALLRPEVVAAMAEADRIIARYASRDEKP